MKRSRAKLKTEATTVIDRKTPPFEQFDLPLQGGGAPGSYRGGVYRALADADLQPDWVAGISISAVERSVHRRQSAGAARRYDVSRTMGKHGKAGYDEAVRTLQDPESLKRPDRLERVRPFEFAGFEAKQPAGPPAGDPTGARAARGKGGA